MIHGSINTHIHIYGYFVLLQCCTFTYIGHITRFRAAVDNFYLLSNDRFWIPSEHKWCITRTVYNFGLHSTLNKRPRLSVLYKVNYLIKNWILVNVFLTLSLWKVLPEWLFLTLLYEITWEFRLKICDCKYER